MVVVHFICCVCSFKGHQGVWGRFPYDGLEMAMRLPSLSLFLDTVLVALWRDMVNSTGEEAIQLLYAPPSVAQ